MGHNIRQQITYAVRQSMMPGQDKHAQKGHRKPKDGRTYSYSDFHAKLDVAKQFGKWLQENCPDIRQARDITTAEVQSFLQEKAFSGCRQASLDRYASDLRSIALEIRTTYHTSSIGKVERVHAIEGAADPIRTAVGITRPNFERLLGTYPKPTDSGRCALLLSFSAGLRAAGCCWVTREDIRISDDKTIVHVTEKGGRHRDVVVIDAQKQEILKQLHDQTPPGQHIVADRYGKSLKPESLLRNIDRHKDTAGLDNIYQHQSIHAVRKLWAQEEYDRYRETHSKYETIRWVNVQLGHGADRDEKLLAHYVNNMH